tara:strand:- start:469 stop:1107 length:639 start_codon:yes stop_codon:yes gene_type:complete
MDKLTISIFGSKIFPEIIKEIKLFSKARIKYYENLNLYINEIKEDNNLLVFFVNDLNKSYLDKIKTSSFPVILIFQQNVKTNLTLGEMMEKLIMPFKISDFIKKIISLNAKNNFKKNSLINLKDYIIDKNERKIKKNNLELQLSEKEINFLILFTKTNKPITKDKVLQSAWNYSRESETHTVETHVHRLRKKILEKFDDNNFIKNNNKGYYI